MPCARSVRRAAPDIDLGRWVAGAYVITGGESDSDEDGDEGIAKELGSLERGEGSDDEAVSSRRSCGLCRP